jgi:Ribbon-helix-helix domain
LQAGECNVVSNPKGKQVQVMGYYSPEAAKQLRKLSELTRIPQAALLREALGDLLKKHALTLRKPC